jgi:hypothetical protein
MQRNVGGAEGGPEVVALLAEPVGRGPRLAEKLAHCDPVVLASNGDQRGQMHRAPCRQVLRRGGRQPGLQGSRCGHRDAGGLLDLTGSEEDVPKVIGAGRHQQWELRRLRGREGALGGDPGQFGLTHLGQRLGGDVVGLREDAEGAAPVVAGQLVRYTLDFANQPGTQQAGFFVVGRLVETIRLVDIAS